MSSKDSSDAASTAAGGAPLVGGPLRPPSASGNSETTSDGLRPMRSGSDAETEAQSVARSRDYYRKVGQEYDVGMDWLFKSFFSDEEAVRSDLIDLLEIGPGSCVLETGCGTGRDILNIARRIDSPGRLYATDLSPEMMRLGLERLADNPAFDAIDAEIVFLVCDATTLPFSDNQFDAAFHFGGLNLYSNVAKGLSEMARVVKPGGKVVVGDEGLAPWLRSTEFGEILVNSNPLYRNTAPVELVPVEADKVCLRWILGGAFYVFDFVVRDGPPKLDLDLPIPGHRGGTHRTRFHGKLEGIDPAIRDRAREAARAAGMSFEAWLAQVIQKSIPD